MRQKKLGMLHNYNEDNIIWAIDKRRDKCKRTIQSSINEKS
jgi:hypothetical protein